MMEVTDKRECMANQLLARGHATMQELLTASFGEWPPNGLNIDPAIKHDQKVLLQPFVKGTLFGQASSVKGEKRVIEINKEFCETGDGVNDTLGHESIHILQGDNAHRKQRNVIQKMLYKLMGKSDPASNIIMQELTGKKEGSLSEAFSQAIGKGGREEWRENIKFLNYLKEGIEVQARIHEFMIQGYPRWEKLPTNRDEFFAAMKNSGLKLPPEIEQHLENLPANSSARQFLSAKMEGKALGAVDDIQQVSDSFTKAGQDIFWNKTMPALYADLMKMYGDVQGAKTFDWSAGNNKKLSDEMQNARSASIKADTDPINKKTTPSLS